MPGEPQLSPDALDVLKTLGLNEPDAPVSDDDLFALLTGWAPEDERVRIIHALTRSETLRDRFVEARTALLRGAPGDALQRFMERAIDVFRRVAEFGLASVGPEGALVIGPPRLSPGTVAISRSSENTIRVGENLVFVRFEAQLDGSLRIHGSGAAQGNSVAVAYKDPIVGLVPLGRATADENGDFILDALGLPMDISLGLLDIRLLNEPDEAVLRVQSDDEILEIPLRAAPRVDSGDLILDFAQPERLASQVGDRSVEIGLRVGRAVVPLLKCQARDLTSPVRVPLPGASDGPLPPYSLSCSLK